MCTAVAAVLLKADEEKCNVLYSYKGSLWSLAGAMLYAVYIVMIKRRVDREDKLDIPMFFGKKSVCFKGQEAFLLCEVV